MYKCDLGMTQHLNNGVDAIFGMGWRSGGAKVNRFPSEL